MENGTKSTYLYDVLMTRVLEQFAVDAEQTEITSVVVDDHVALAIHGE